MDKKNHKIERECLKCGTIQSLTVTKKEAAFDLIDYDRVLGVKCPKCFNKQFSITFQNVTLDLDILKEWSLDSELYLQEQDEELLLADELYLDIVLKTLDTHKILDHKRNILLEALCIIVYDNTIKENPKRDEDLKNRVIFELNTRIEQLRLADDWVMDYIKEVVYPQLNTM
ncbi:hypothetical protein [Aquimarina algicola]|uniref:CpXC domain-containing protein n=1 Tax=Aquimarina algicola TaxID=2589995 RepID=A0A504JQ38_9FLAO|nr:hypothetical protein [Aquimarina algicola]TPN88881.1 hypothetical protein FHK87_01310 [Aquimarina algicola]